ncbi:hypothetical protein T11_1648 [Trichinella zimbabwensis]|uniref:Uncharacterized protein n=1 Tax=Trichinella zimbabwensis TaxID=268475 RepID=A0A0V1GDF7_9BILA|nr:hypothetical protein T11_6394 [Trichinella zimbabwensis]KRY98747.1 hypothetical protein T11_1648 [Trichinella zimbabwensis]
MSIQCSEKSNTKNVSQRCHLPRKSNERVAPVLMIRHLYGDRYLHSAALETGFSALEPLC